MYEWQTQGPARCLTGGIELSFLGIVEWRDRYSDVVSDGVTGNIKYLAEGKIQQHNGLQLTNVQFAVKTKRDQTAPLVVICQTKPVWRTVLKPSRTYGYTSNIKLREFE